MVKEGTLTVKIDWNQFSHPGSVNAWLLPTQDYDAMQCIPAIGRHYSGERTDVTD